MSKVFADVHVFMHSAGQTIPPFNANPSAQSDLYFELIKEEYRELMDASIDKNDTEICDACRKGSYGTNLYGQGVLNNLIDKIERAGGTCSILSEETNWLEINYE